MQPCDETGPPRIALRSIRATRQLTEALAACGAEAKRAFDAMIKMRKIDVAAIEAARHG